MGYTPTLLSSSFGDEYCFLESIHLKCYHDTIIHMMMHEHYRDLQR